MLNKDLLFFKVFEDLNKYNSIIREKISILDIEEYENKYNFKFPSDYKEFLLEYNGCDLKDNIKEKGKKFHLINKYCGVDYSISNFPSIKIQIEELEEDWFFFEELVQNKFIPIAHSINDFIHLMVYCGKENENYGKIYLVNEDEIPRYVCNSFSEFITGYYFKEYGE